MAVLTSIILAVIVVWILISAYLSADNSMRASADGASYLLTDQKDRCVQVLKDLELDFATGKITAQEYEKMRLSLGSELGALFTKLDSKKG